MSSLSSVNGMYSEKTNRRILIAGIVMFCLFVIIRDIMHIGYSKYILVALAGAVAVFLNYSNLISFISFLIPLSCGIPGNYIFMILAILYVLKTPTLSKYHLIFSSIFIGQEILFGLLFSGSDIVELIAYCIKVFLTFGIIFDQKDNRCNEHLIAFVLGATFLLVMVFSITTQLVEFEYIISGEFRLGETKVPGMRTIQFGTNANTIGFYSLLSISVCLILMKLTKGLKWLYIPSIALNLFIGLLTVSRSYIVFLALVVVLFLFSGFNPSGKSFFTLILALVLVAFFVGYLAENTTIFEGYETRFKDSTTQSGGGRTDIMKNYFDWQSSNSLYLLFGVGALNHVKLSGFGSPHNGFQQVMVSYGLFGFVIMISALIMAMTLFTSDKKIPKVAYIPFISTILFLQTVQLLMPTEYFMSLIYMYIVLKLFSTTRHNPDKVQLYKTKE